MNKAFIFNIETGEEGKEFITKDFINNLKLELCQKVKPSKSILEALKHSNAINQSYKRNIEQLNSKIEELLSQNRHLKQQVSELEKNLQQSSNAHSSLILSYTQHKQRSSQQLKKQENQSENQLFDIHLLNEKVKHLEEYKTMKESRFAEIIEREAQYVGEINILKYKNQNLQSSIKELESQLQRLKNKSEQTLQKFIGKRSEASERFKEYINHEDSYKSDQSIDELKQIHHLIIPRQQHLLLESQTQVIHIEDQQATRAADKRKKTNCSFIQMDCILRDQVANFNTNSLINNSEKEVHENLNSSIIVINVNPQPEQYILSNEQ